MDEQLRESEHETEYEIALPGLVGGMVAGTIGLVPACLFSAIAGHGLFRPLELIGATVYRETANLHAAGPALIGLLLLLFVSGSLGVIYNAIIPRGAPYHWATAVGVAYGGIVFLLVQWLLLPWVDPVFYQSVPAVLLLAYNLIYGAALPIAVVLRRVGRVEHRHHDERELHA